MSKNIICILLSISILFPFFSCSNKTPANSNTNNNKIKVFVSFNPLKELTEAIGKDKVEIETIIPQGTEPHDFEPKARDLEKLSKADIFIYNGLGMENWVDKSLNVIDNKNLIVVEASKDCEPIKISNKDDYDPHTWLSLKCAKIESNNIKNALIKADPENKEFYEKNFNEFSTKIDSLYNEYKEKFNSTSNKNFVTGHAAFGYFCRDFDLKQNSVEDIFAESEPTAQKIKQLIEYCKKNNVNTIFTEETASPKVSETLAKEVNAKVEKIYTIEINEDNKNYIESMEYNLEKVYNSLKN